MKPIWQYWIDRVLVKVYPPIFQSCQCLALRAELVLDREGRFTTRGRYDSVVLVTAEPWEIVKLGGHSGARGIIVCVLVHRDPVGGARVIGQVYRIGGSGARMHLGQLELVRDVLGIEYTEFREFAVIESVTARYGVLVSEGHAALACTV
jgi:hypothetical protein